jgi:hypothetical protein
MQKIGDGTKFRKLKKQLAGKKGVKNPAALAAWVGRKKFGKQRYAELSKEGREKAEQFRSSQRRIKV